MATWILLQIWSSVLLTYPYIILIVHLFAGTFSEQDTFLGRGFFGCRGVSLSWPPPLANDEGGTSHLMWMMSKWTYRTSVWSFSRTPRCFGWGRKTDVHLGERVGVFFSFGIFFCVATVGGRNFAPVDLETSSFFTGFDTSQMVRQMFEPSTVSIEEMVVGALFMLQGILWVHRHFLASPKSIHHGLKNDFCNTLVGIHKGFMARFDKCTPWKMNIINMDPKVWMLWKGVYTWDVWVSVFVFRGVHMLDHGNSFLFENEPLKSMKERVSCQTIVFANGRCVFWWAHNDANGLLPWKIEYMEPKSMEVDGIWCSFSGPG